MQLPPGHSDGTLKVSSLGDGSRISDCVAKMRVKVAVYNYINLQCFNLLLRKFISSISKSRRQKR